jgi:hypothetical protein
MKRDDIPPAKVKPSAFDRDDHYAKEIAREAAIDLECAINKDPADNYDQRPVVDNNNLLALAVINNMKSRGMDDQLCNYALEIREEIVDLVSETIRQGRVDPPAMTAYEAPAESSGLPLMTRKEQLDAIANAAYAVSEEWTDSRTKHLDVHTRVYGAVGAVLGLLEDGSETFGIPAFQLTPITSAEGHSCLQTLKRADYGQVDWNYGEPMTLAPPAESGDGLLNSFGDVYDTLRKRYTASAKELFG